MGTRKFSRVKFNVSAVIHCSGKQFRGEVGNLSMSGMFMETSEKLAIGDEVEIGIILSGTSPEICVNFNGRVCRIIEEGLGFSFEKIDLDSYTHLKNIIAYNIDDSEKVMEEIYDSLDQKFSAS